MNRVRRTVRQKSPSPTAEEPMVSGGGRKRAKPFDTMSGGGSPILTHRPLGSGSMGGLGASYTIGFGGGYRPSQVRPHLLNCHGYCPSPSPQPSLLQSVIRNLVDSEGDDERRSLRMGLESDLEVTSERLDSLVQGVCACMRMRMCVRVCVCMCVHVCCVCMHVCVPTCNPLMS